MFEKHEAKSPGNAPFACADPSATLATTLLNPAHLELRAGATPGWVGELADDFDRAAAGLSPGDPRAAHLAALGHAVRLDREFLTLHPGALFQCLWNSCWWFDHPSAEAHYAEPPGGWHEANAPWRRPGPKLHEWLEAWRRRKETETPGFVWLRSARPPEGPLLLRLRGDRTRSPRWRTGRRLHMD